jgi:hypothetical protein
MVANTPYIIKCCKETAPFEALADVAVAASATLNDVHCGIATMSGVLSTTILNSDASTSYYGYNSADGSFVKIGSNGTAYPFRAFISIPSTGAEVKSIGVEHGNGELTGITEVDDTNATSAVDVYTVDGEFIGNFESLKYVSEKFDADMSSISASCRKENRTSKGYVFRYSGDDFDYVPYTAWNRKPVIQKSINGEFIAEFECSRVAQETLKLPTNANISIRDCCRGKQ